MVVGARSARLFTCYYLKVHVPASCKELFRHGLMPFQGRAVEQASWQTSEREGEGERERESSTRSLPLANPQWDLLARTKALDSLGSVCVGEDNERCCCAFRSLLNHAASMSSASLCLIPSTIFSIRVGGGEFVERFTLLLNKFEKVDFQVKSHWCLAFYCHFRLSSHVFSRLFGQSAKQRFVDSEWQPWDAIFILQGGSLRN